MRTETVIVIFLRQISPSWLSDGRRAVTSRDEPISILLIRFYRKIGRKSKMINISNDCRGDLLIILRVLEAVLFYKKTLKYIATFWHEIFL